MRYSKFTIKNYRAISDEMEIDVIRSSLIPIIGINESGKTTILQGIFGFDSYNDSFNHGRHLSDTVNLYQFTQEAPAVTAEIQATPIEINELLDLIDSKLEIAEDSSDEPDSRRASLNRYRGEGLGSEGNLQITRNLQSRVYSLSCSNCSCDDEDLNKIIVDEIIRLLPFTLYFDDFRESIDERIEIVRGTDGQLDGWLAIFEQLFKQTNENYSVFSLANMEQRQRLSVLAQVKRHLNETLTRAWQRFQLDDHEALELAIDFEQEGGEGVSRAYLRLHIIETDKDGNEHFFYIRDRSKGFFWFFNFVMKLEFNPKVVDENEQGTVYLLDEPGSYLHASAQAKLCEKLRQLSERNVVIYCTHSHYLLDPDVIPFSKIRIAEKDGNGSVALISVNDHKGDVTERRGAFQPIVDALHIKPFLMDLTSERILIVEGIVDYYAFEMFKGVRDIKVLPSVGADSIIFYISLMIAWRMDYQALWDNDEQGRIAKNLATQKFGANVADGHFFLLPLTSSRQGKRNLEKLFTTDDLRSIRTQLTIPGNTSFKKTIANLYYHPSRKQIMNGLSTDTHDSFNQIFQMLGM